MRRPQSNDAEVQNSRHRSIEKEVMHVAGKVLDGYEMQGKLPGFTKVVLRQFFIPKYTEKLSMTGILCCRTSEENVRGRLFGGGRHPKRLYVTGSFGVKRPKRMPEAEFFGVKGVTKCKKNFYVWRTL